VAPSLSISHIVPVGHFSCTAGSDIVTEEIPAHRRKCPRERWIPLVNALQCCGHVRMFLVNPVAFTWCSIFLRNHTCIFYASDSLFLKLWAVLDLKFAWSGHDATCYIHVGQNLIRPSVIWSSPQGWQLC